MSGLERGASYPRRRQNRSCDQCRAGKRGCDAVVTPRQAVSPRLDVSGQTGKYVTATKDAPFAPCTNCKRWKKQCTFDWFKARTERRPPQRAAAHQAKPRQQQQFRTSFHSLEPKLLHPRGQVALESFDNIQPVGGDCFSSTKPIDGNSSRRFDTGSILSSALGIPNHYTDDFQGRGGGPAELFGARQEEPAQPTLDGSCSPPSMPWSFSQHLADEHSRIHIRSRLVKIFHESMQDFMSCWLIEKSCPFVARSLPNNAKNPSISNRPDRILSRVHELDQSLFRAGMLSKCHHNQGFNTIYLVAMAFATQWAYLVDEGHHHTWHRASSAPAMFGRDLHRSLWHRAKLALGEALTNPSFKAIFAGIIFASTTRPRDADESQEENRRSSSSGQATSNSAILDSLFQQYDTGQLFLDVALRKLHEHMRKQGSIRHERRHPTWKSPQPPGADDQQTLGVVFWLAVMTDTLSAAINCRPFVVSDRDVNILYRESHNRNCVFPADCCLDQGSSEHPAAANTQEGFQVWGAYFLKGASCAGDVWVQTLRWPCSYFDAASCLADAVPVLVLLFRRIAQLQDLNLRHAPPQEMASYLVATIDICQHWDNTYAWFLTDCLINHENLPSHIQSWYILLTSNWNLGIIILSDLIERCYEHAATTTDVAIPVWARDFLTAKRLLAAYAISDLAHCCCIANGTWPTPNFQGAVNKLPLLKEPWSTVLVRSFASAGEIFFRLVQSQGELVHALHTENILESLRRLGHCIEALRLLGKTSDMASHAAIVLQGLTQDRVH